jgi:tetratricopeptide (TPR) repeat protein
MKSYLPIIASLFLASTPFIPPVTATETEIIAQNIDPHIKNNIARQITVKITSAESGGSGVIIGKQNNTYLVLTNNHVIRNGDSFSIQTHDGVTHQAKPVNNAIQSNDDLALLEFSSDKSYQTANINTAATPKVEQDILAVGYSAETGKLVIQEGKIGLIPDKTFKDGYSVGYSSNILQGMSGGAILNTDGEVIGINGKSAFPIINTGYVYQDGSQPTPAEIDRYRQLSWGLSLNSLLTQLNPEIITAYNLPLPETVDEVDTQLTGWLGELEAKAKQITVRIDSSSGANGSGVIIAKEGNSYTVLTADHVICEKDKETRECIDYTYEILASDGKKYPVDASTINRQEGVDLAVVKFTSNENYQVAQLANYPVTANDAVFVVGYPRLDRNKPAPWLFSLGYGLDRETGLILVNDNKLSTDSSGLTQSQGSLSGGYEMVYTSITYGGMSGGAVLDKDGRVIGIHGLAEGQEALDSQSSPQKQIQLGYSLGIPLNTFIGLADRLRVAGLPIQENRPKELNAAETQAFQDAILGTEIPQGNATAERWIERGNQLWRLSRYFEAVEAFDKAIALKPEFIHLAYYGKGLALGSQDEYEAALASLELATQTKSDFAPAFLYKSAVLQKLNQFEEALAAIEAAISLQPDNANLYNEKGYILSDLKRYAEGEVAYNQAIDKTPRSTFYNNRGLLYYNQGKPELALADWNKAIALNPNLAPTYSNRGNLYSNQGKPELAIADYNKAISLNPNYADAYNNRGNLYSNQGKLDLALADYNKAISLNPNIALAYYNRGVLYDNQGKPELAIADYNKEIALNPNIAEAYSNRGLFYSNQGKLDLALADYNKAISINPNIALAYYNRGLFYSNQGKLDLALADYNKAISLNPNYADAYNNRGNLYSNQGKLDLALADYNKAISINPNIALAYYNRGLFYSNQGKLDLALADYNKAISLNPNYADAYYNRGNLYSNQGKLDLALADYNKAISLNPNYADAYYNRGNLYSNQGKLDLALADYNKAISINPNYADAYNNRGNLYSNQGKPELALADYNKAISINPNIALAYYNRGLFYSNQGKLDLALADYNKAISLNPNIALAYYNRGLFYSNQGKLDLALADYNKAISLNPNYADAYNNRGLIYAQQGILDLAEADFKRVIAINPNYPNAYVGLGVVYQQKKYIAAARTNLQKAQQLSLAQGNTALAQTVANLLQQLP